MTMTFDAKARIVAEYWSWHEGRDPEWVRIYDLGGPLAAAYAQGEIEGLADTSRYWIEEAYDGLIDGFGIDPLAEFDDLDQILEVAGYE